MSEDSDLTAYCGLYCIDCIPSNARLFELLEELRELASELCLAEYAELIAARNPALEDYEAFARVLDALAQLRCPAPCRAGGGNPRCAIRECALGKGYDGCWECPMRRECGLLQPLRDFHGGNIDANLDIIAEYGPRAWAGKRKRHYPWSGDRGPATEGG